MVMSGSTASIDAEVGAAAYILVPGTGMNIAPAGLVLNVTGTPETGLRLPSVTFTSK